MSGTIESARLAAQSFSMPVTIVDSKSNSMSLGWQVLAMARAREKGAGVDGMKQVDSGQCGKACIIISCWTHWIT